MTTLNYAEDLRIDPDALDVEWLHQAELYMSYSEEAADARKDMDSAKEVYDVVKAEAEMEVRGDPEHFHIAKLTEATANAAVVQHPKVRGAAASMIEMRGRYELTLGAVRAFEQRKSALENLTRLAVQGYFATPEIPRDLPAENARSTVVKRIKGAGHKEATEQIQESRRSRRRAKTEEG